MNSEKCRRIGCKYFGKSSGKAACYFSAQKTLLKHVTACPLIIEN